jgi:hypothetical protein
VTQGTSATDPNQLIVPTLKALADEDRDHGRQAGDDG